MKKITILVLLAGIILTGFTACHSDTVEPPRRYPPDLITNYTYKNNSSNTISVTIFSRDITSGENRHEEFNIDRSKQHEIEHMNGSEFLRPFSLFYYRDPSYDRVNVSNGKVVVKQRSPNGYDTPDELFDVNKYVKTEEIIEENNGKHITRYTYTFTDDFFKNGEPIEK